MTFTPDAQVAAVLAAAFERSCPPPSPPVGDVASRRVALDAMLGYFNNQAQPVASKVDISDHGVVTPDGATLLARWYRQPSSETKAAVLYLHGGGMIVGSVPIFDGPVSRYVARTGVSMLSLEYRLAPEHPCPTPVEDAYAGLVWLVGHAAELGVDPGRIAVMGDSAGGGRAAGVAGLPAWAAADRRRVLRAPARCVRSVPGSGARSRRSSSRSKTGAAMPRSSMPLGVSSTIDERRSEGLARRAHSPADSRRSTAWLAPPTVIATARAMSWTRHSGVASMTSMPFRLARPTPHSSCSRPSTAPHRIVSNLTRSSNTCRRSVTWSPVLGRTHNLS